MSAETPKRRVVMPWMVKRKRKPAKERDEDQIISVTNELAAEPRTPTKPPAESVVNKAKQIAALEEANAEAEKIVSQAKKEAEEMKKNAEASVSEEAKAEAEKIVSQAKKEAEEMKKNAEASVSEEAKAEAEKIVSQAKLEAEEMKKNAETAVKEVAAEEKIETPAEPEETAAEEKKEEPAESPPPEKVTTQVKISGDQTLYTGEIELIIASPVDPKMMAALFAYLQTTPEAKLVHSTGSLDRGTTITVALDKPVPIISALSSRLPEVEPVVERGDKDISAKGKKRMLRIRLAPKKASKEERRK
ncbi:MAG: ATP synthase F0 subunit B [Dehalococcoidia bacterium]|nr:MAG: ATP synthase F0 subunit B [Dehalococcoidia bacterium]